MIRSSRHGTVETNLPRSHELWVRSLTLLSGLRIWYGCGCGVVAAIAPSRPLAWEPPYATSAVLKSKKKNLKQMINKNLLSAQENLLNRL